MGQRRTAFSSAHPPHSAAPCCLSDGFMAGADTAALRPLAGPPALIHQGTLPQNRCWMRSLDSCRYTVVRDRCSLRKNSALGRPRARLLFFCAMLGRRVAQLPTSKPSTFIAEDVTRSKCASEGGIGVRLERFPAGDTFALARVLPVASHSPCFARPGRGRGGPAMATAQHYYCRQGHLLPAYMAAPTIETGRYGHL